MLLLLTEELFCGNPMFTTLYMSLVPEPDSPFFFFAIHSYRANLLLLFMFIYFAYTAPPPSRVSVNSEL